jgi:hypothetical protein
MMTKGAGISDEVRSKRLLSTSWLAAACIVATTGAMSWWTWGTWTDPFVDFGRELYLAWQLSQGRVLYVDVASFNGPLSPYVNAFWFRIFGVSLRSLVLGNFVLLLVLLWLLFAIFRHIADTFSATLACIVFITVFAFGEYIDIGNYNFITPYSHELTHGVILSFAGIYALQRFVNSGSIRAAWAAGCALGLIFLTKPEVFLAAAVALGAGIMLAIVWMVSKHALGSARAILAIGSGFSLPVFVAYGLLALAMPPHDAFFGLVGSWRYVLDRGLTSMPFYANIGGFSHPLASMRMIVGATIALTMLFGGTALAAFAWPHKRFGLEAALSISALLVLLLLTFHSLLGLNRLALPLPCLMGGLMLVLTARLRRNWRDSEDGKATIVGLTLVIFSGMLLGKIFLNVQLYHYGFALAMPATLTLIVALVGWMPGAISTHGGSGRLFKLVATGAIIITASLFLSVHHRRLTYMQYAVGSGGDRFLADTRGAAMASTVAAIEARLGPGDRFVAFPEGAMLNYLTRRPSSSPFTSFRPSESRMFGPERLLDSLRRDPPEYLALVDRPIEEYGFNSFDRDFNREISVWVSETYQPEATFPASTRFRVRLLRRQPSHHLSYR